MNYIFQRICQWFRIDVIRKFKFWFQRRVRGFDDTEIWDLSIPISQFVLIRLKEYRKISPVDRISEADFFVAIDKIIIAFELIIRDDAESRDSDEVQEGLDLFSKYFLSLWY